MSNYFHTDNASTTAWLAGVLHRAQTEGLDIRLSVDANNSLKVKLGEGMWSAPIESTPDPYRDNINSVKGFKWFLNEDGEPYCYPAEYQHVAYPGDFHTPYDSEEDAKAASERLP